jgi:hypothetical protein
MRDIPQLRDALWNNRRVFFEGFERGFDALYPRPMAQLTGDIYGRVRPRLDEAIDHRNKIFHGQLTSRSLSRDDLLGFVSDIRAWCEAVARVTQADFDYDGFSNSFRKSTVADLPRRLRVQFADVGAYAQFIRDHMQRR